MIGQKTEQVAGVPINSKKFEAALDRLLPQPSKDGMPVRTRLRDAQFRQLAQFCNQSGHPQWGLRPRTFAVLRMIGVPDLIENFVEERLTDIHLPYSEGNLPSFVSGQIRLLFLDCQNYVLNGRAASLERCGEPHQNVKGSADDYFIYIEDLGAGGFGEVDSVIGEMSLMNFARKRIKRHRLYSQDRVRLQVIENELQTLKSLSHQHLVQLVGSYTDSSCVGLIMSPVAEMNLETYLKGVKSQDSRKLRLRCFFGCLANALSYLHSRHVQHKDIKPANILVRQQKVYITDFGISRSWDNDVSKTTQGTVFAFTPRYCAPEVVQFGSSRNESRDIWSLGCVFLEMCSVLAGFTVEEQYSFFQTNGTHREYLRENDTGARLWGEKLISAMITPEDRQPLELALHMCTVKPEKRPLAAELVSAIFDFNSPPRYFGLCCDEQCSFSERSNETTLEGDIIPEGTGTPTLINKADESLATEAMWPQKLSYRSPTVEDPTEERTLRAFFHPTGVARRHVLEDANRIKEGDDNTLVGKNLDHGHSRDADASPRAQQHASKEPQLESSSSTPLSLEYQRPGHGPNSLTGLLYNIRNLDSTQLQCPWPRCSVNIKFSGRENLTAHLRGVHGTHELFWTPLLPGLSKVATTRERGRWIPAPTSLEPTKSQRTTRQVRFADDDGNLITTTDDHHQDSSADGIVKTKKRTTNNPGKIVNQQQMSDLDQSRYSAYSGRGKPYDAGRGKPPFSLLPAALRPEKIKPRSTEYEESSREEPTVFPERVQDPLITSNQEGFPIPKSSLVPSYFLATTNQLPSHDISNSQLSIVPPPLFVYGSLMFPSILRALATRLKSAEGIYSRALQRRIPTSVEDWAGVSESLQQASQQMTPALLEGYLRFRPMGCRDAALTATLSPNAKQELERPPPKGSDGNEMPVSSNTRGLIVFGLSWEAIACLDHAFRGEKTEEKSSPADSGSERSTSFSNRNDDRFDSLGTNDTNSNNNKLNTEESLPFSRKKIQATVCTADGQRKKIWASTYIFKDSRQDDYRLRPWDVNRFARSRTLRQLSADKTTSPPYNWVAEEKSLAKKMGMVYAMVGDELLQKVLEDDLDGLEALYAEGCDINAPCHHFGTPLQAAAAKGHEDMVHVMLNSMKADPHVKGGKYHYPLIAAITEGHEFIVQMLLRSGANPMVNAGSFVSPVYQAVSFEDVEMVKLLLEGGAWLSENYDELQDIAIERGNNMLCELLTKYDIRRFHQRRQVRDGKGDEQDGTLDNETNQLSHLKEQRDLSHGSKARALPALFKIMQLKGRKGKWTGIKGILVLREYFADDVPEQVIDLFRRHYQATELLLFELANNFPDSNTAAAHPRLSHDNKYLKKATSTKTNDRPVRPSNATSQQHLCSQERRAPKSRDHSEIYKDEDPFCLTCDNHGGRKGTGRRCSACQGSGAVSESHKAGSPNNPHVAKCRGCKGKGSIFSQRDRCRMCNTES